MLTVSPQISGIFSLLPQSTAVLFNTIKMQRYYKKFKSLQQFFSCCCSFHLYHFRPNSNWCDSPLKGTVAQDFLSRFFSRIYSIWAPDFEAKRIFFSLSFLRSYSNISMNPHCRLLRGFKTSAVAYWAYCHSPMQLLVLMYDIIFPYKSALQATAAIQNQHCSLLLLLKNPRCSLQCLLTIPAVSYISDSMATARIHMSNFE